MDNNCKISNLSDEIIKNGSFVVNYFICIIHMEFSNDYVDRIYFL